MKVINIIKEKFCYLEKKGMAIESTDCGIIYRISNMAIEFCYNDYDKELIVNYVCKDFKCSIPKLLYAMGKSDFNVISIICTSEDFLSNKLAYYADLLESTIDLFINNDCIIVEAYNRILNEIKTKFDIQNDKQLYFEVNDCIKAKNYERALSLLMSKPTKTVDDLKKIELLMDLIKKQSIYM